jgi:DNA-binding ferritin-like protein
VPVGEVVKLVTALLVQAGSTTRAAADHAAEYDAVTQDLLNQVIGALEQHAWMFSAQGRG